MMGFQLRPGQWLRPLREAGRRSQARGGAGVGEATKGKENCFGELPLDCHSLIFSANIKPLKKIPGFSSPPSKE